MFALALGIDYALFVVMRFRGAYFGSGLSAEEAAAMTMDAARLSCSPGRPCSSH
jgi:RND superfamily putative drug exporter